MENHQDHWSIIKPTKLGVPRWGRLNCFCWASWLQVASGKRGGTSSINAVYSWQTHRTIWWIFRLAIFDDQRVPIFWSVLWGFFVHGERTQNQIWGLCLQVGELVRPEHSSSLPSRQQHLWRWCAGHVSLLSTAQGRSKIPEIDELPKPKVNEPFPYPRNHALTMPTRLDKVWLSRAHCLWIYRRIHSNFKHAEVHEFMLVGFQLGWPLPPQKRSGVRTREFHMTGVRDAFFKAGCISCASNGGLLENHFTDFFIAL